MSRSEQVVDAFELDPAELGKAGVNAVRAAFGLVGILAVAAGVALFVWPDKTITVVAAIVGTFLVISGIARLALGIFSRGLSAGHRILDLVLGVVVLLAGIIVLRNLSTSAEALLLIAVLAIGISWIIEGIMAIVESGRSGNGAAGVAFGVFAILAGIAVMVWPGLTAIAFATLISIALIVLGIVGIGRAFSFGKSVKTAS